MRVITYDEKGEVVTDYTSPWDDESTAEEFAEKALHHPKARRVSVWSPELDPATDTPIVQRVNP